MSWRVFLGSLLIIFIGIRATDSVGLAWPVLTTAADEVGKDDLSGWDGFCRQVVKPQLPDERVIGYQEPLLLAANTDQARNDLAYHLSLLQYSLAPTLVEPTPDHRVVIVVSPSGVQVRIHGGR